MKHKWKVLDEADPKSDAQCAHCGMRRTKCSSSRGPRGGKAAVLHWEYWRKDVAPRTGKTYMRLSPYAGECHPFGMARS